MEAQTQKPQTAQAQKPKLKIYHLIEEGTTSVEHYVRVNQGQRVRSDNRRTDRPKLQITFTDKNGENKTIRLKLNCSSIYQDEQIEKHKIPANEKFTDAERDILYFRNGVLALTNVTAQKFLDAHPENEAFEGECPEVLRKLFREYDPTAIKKKEFGAFKKRVAAANRIGSLGLEESQDMLRRLYGSFYTVPSTLEECTLKLVDYMDDTDDDGLDEILREGKTLEDEVTILVGRAIDKGVISFEEPSMENFVVKKKNNTVLPLKEISSSLPLAERKRQFMVFIASPDGRLLLEDLRKEVGSAEKSKAETPKQQPEPDKKTEPVA